MGRLKDWVYRPFARQRFKGVTVPDYVAAAYLGDSFDVPAPVIESPKTSIHSPLPLIKPAGGGRPYVSNQTKKVNIDNGFWADLMPRDQSAIDFTDAVVFDYNTLLNGPVTVMKRRVPRGRAWHVDNMYFFALALGGITGTFPLGPTDLWDFLALRLFINSSQLEYESWRDYFRVLQLPVPLASFPMLNDRVGNREAKFGVTLYEGESIRATIELRQTVFPPVVPIQTVHFRFMGLEASKANMDDYLRRKKWD